MSWQPDGWQQGGWQPDGWQPDEAGTYPDISNSRRIRLPAGGVWVVDPDVAAWCEIVWFDVLPSGLTLVSVAYTLPSELTLVAAAISTSLAKSAMIVSGQAHGSMLQIVALATLSNGSTIPCTAPLRGFNG